MSVPSDYAIHGVDVSVFQHPALVPADIDFALVRAAFGTRRDKRTVEHVTALRQRTTCVVGLYHFFVPGHSLPDQLGAFGDAADACGLTEGDMFPWVDVESPKSDGSMPPRPEWCGPLRDLLASLQDVYGQVGVYITQRDWTLLGKPEWLLELPLWVAHWRGAPGAPASPGGVQPVLWQYRVGPWDRGALHRGEHAARNAIDHDCCVAVELPLIVPQGEPVRDTVRPPAIPWVGLDDDDWEAMRAERNASLEELDP